MPIPDMTHLQFLILGTLLDGEKSGQQVRDELAKNRVKKSGPAFYQLMARLEDAKFVKGHYDEKVIDGQRIKERRYVVTGGGVRAWQRTREFYQSFAMKSLPGGLAHA